MKNKLKTFIISEQAEYEVQATSAQKALDKFLSASAEEFTKFPVTVNEREVFNADGEQEETEDQ